MTDTDYKSRRSAAVPSSRLSRMASLTGLAGRVAGNLVAEGSKHWLRGQRPAMSELLLSRKNLEQVADRLARMRGAAMKLGQLISMDSGALLPPEMAQILERLRDDAVIMPAAQLVSVLEENWGSDWDQRLAQFSFEPVAAASIGQVHKGRTHGGRELAIKIQYPGVRRSIDSDIDNVVSLLRLSGLLPRDMDIDPLVAEAKQQLRLETDYLHEQRQLLAYDAALKDFRHYDALALPGVDPDLSTEQLLCMDFLDGVSLTQAAAQRPELQHQIPALLLEMFFCELFQLRSVQTDPNPANYQYSLQQDQLILLDFGAVRHFPTEFVRHYHSAICAATDRNAAALAGALEALGFFSQRHDAANRKVVLEIFMEATEPLRTPGPYDFGGSDLARRIHERGMAISSDPDAWHTPPADVLFLHRKMGGLFMLAAQLGARVDVHAIFSHYREMP
ncbi:ABC1 kinase family protein [Marinobacterium sediminicola]|uniref:Predicted unusual protein kinase regulating ubiquinone biosynthesis, AarF/ABC1/UbiB family n=1 Tax=Marinobacterium sediminicola TaxID=518898 RepID=A0ABY1S1I1_9GAMM|nr:AarF/ABC1/UbiB kinase family protein [Marinobacterium sediminicola]ULG69391.1 AarF/ABC1/UbiB kinase family protein [Marinobacterium sediminicola]SMR75539.1 Predicted unusual protein kinase regulating ubiquinone biosynthesis, AarF/ABC1/UbiB family [Marinobacterium sediminicola]